MSEWKLGNPNKSFTYILPMLGKSESEFYDEFRFPKNQFVNVFIGDDSNGLSDCILLLYRFSGKKEYIALEDALRNHPNYVTCYEPDKYHTMYVFSVPAKYMSEYEKFLKSKYSHFSESYKKHILVFHAVGEKSSIGNVLYRREEARKALEDDLNKGIARSNWITIGKEDEVSSAIIREKEFYQENYKRKEGLNPSKEFNLDNMQDG